MRRRKPRRKKPYLYRFYEEFRATGDSAAFVQAVGRLYTLATLERLAEYSHPRVRRAATIALGMLGDFRVNPVLGRRLNDADRGVRIMAESLIREIWCRDGNVTQRHQLQRLLRLNGAGQAAEAIVEATTLLEEAPWFAEVWNQRAIAYFIRTDFARSARDCHQALELNPYHFGAAVGMGRCYLEMDESRLALEAFRRALKLNPSLEGIRAQIVLLEKTLGGK